MGFLHQIFGTKIQSVNPDRSGSKPVKQNRRWSFAKSQLTTPCSSRFNGLDNPSTLSGIIGGTLGANKHAIAVAAATAAVAEAALAAANAADEVVRLTSSAGTSVPRCPSSTHVSHSQRMAVEEIAVCEDTVVIPRLLGKKGSKGTQGVGKVASIGQGTYSAKENCRYAEEDATLVRLQSRARASRISTTETLHSSKSSLSHYPISVRNEHWEHSYNTHGIKFEGSSVLKRCSSNSNFREIDAARTQLDTNWLDHWLDTKSLHIGITLTRHDTKPANPTQHTEINGQKKLSHVVLVFYPHVGIQYLLLCVLIRTHCFELALEL